MPTVVLSGAKDLAPGPSTIRPQRNLATIAQRFIAEATNSRAAAAHLTKAKGFVSPLRGFDVTIRQ